MQKSAGEVGAIQHCFEKLRPLQMGARQVRLAEIRSPEIGTPKVRPGEIKSAQIESSQTGPRQVWRLVPLCPPCIPGSSSLSEQGHMFIVRHVLPLLNHRGALFGW